jgi:hypothetical protein
MRSPNRIEPFLTIVEGSVSIILKNILQIPHTDEQVENIEQSLYTSIKETWKEYPDWRFTQVLVNMLMIPNEPGTWYYMEDGILAQKVIDELEKENTVN